MVRTNYLRDNGILKKKVTQKSKEGRFQGRGFDSGILPLRISLKEITKNVEQVRCVRMFRILLIKVKI